MRGMKAPFVPFHSRDLGVRGASIVRMCLSCLVDLKSDFNHLCGSLHGLYTFWARGLGWIHEERETHTFHSLIPIPCLFDVFGLFFCLHLARTVLSAISPIAENQTTRFVNRTIRKNANRSVPAENSSYYLASRTSLKDLLLSRNIFVSAIRTLEFDETPCKLDSTENPCSFEKCPTPL